MRHGEKAWLALVVAVAGYDFLAREDEMLTDGARRLHERYPWYWRITIVVTALHLLGYIPKNVDPFTHLGACAGRLKRGTVVAWK